MTDIYTGTMVEVDTEEPSKHWGFINCKDEIVVDLGCGRWEHMTPRDQSWPTTPEYLAELGATKVYAFDVDPTEIEWFNENVCNKNSKIYAEAKGIHSIIDIRDIYTKYNPTVVKSDIEGAEGILLELTDIEFLTVKHYAIETHTDDIFRLFVEKFASLDYNITMVIDLLHAPHCKVIFAERSFV